MTSWRVTSDTTRVTARSGRYAHGTTQHHDATVSRKRVCYITFALKIIPFDKLDKVIDLKIMKCKNIQHGLRGQSVGARGRVPGWCPTDMNHSLPPRVRAHCAFTLHCSHFSFWLITFVIRTHCIPTTVFVNNQYKLVSVSVRVTSPNVYNIK